MSMKISMDMCIHYLPKVPLVPDSIVVRADVVDSSTIMVENGIVSKHYCLLQCGL